MIDPLLFPREFLLAQKCMEADPLAIAELKETYTKPLTDYLKSQNVDIAEVRIVVEELWVEILVPPREGRPPRLSSYSGNSPLQAWLKAVLLNYWLQHKRHEGRVRQPHLTDPLPDPDKSTTPTPSTMETPDDKPEAPLLDIMQGAVAAAFRACDPEDFLLVHLAHTNGLLGRELAVMFSCSESKISRTLERARQNIAEETLRQVRARDPLLDLKWEDFVELCRVASPACFGLE